MKQSKIFNKMRLPIRQIKYFICVNFLLFSHYLFAQDNSPISQSLIPERVQLILSGYKLSGDSYSFFVQEIGASESLLEINSSLALNPASTMKVLTTQVSLEILTPVFTWQTEIYALGPITNGVLQGDLLIKGGGDPFLVEENFRKMLQALKRLGVDNINGDFVIDDSVFDAAVSNEKSIDNQNSRVYNVRPHALMTNFQTVRFYFYPHSNGRDVRIESDPELPNLAVRNQLRLVNSSCTGYQRGISFDKDPEVENGVVFSGTFPSGCSEYSLNRAVLDAPVYTFGLFQQLWQELGGGFSGNLVFNDVPDELEPIVVWSSPPLGDVIKSINKYSNNLMTRHLLLTLGIKPEQSPLTTEKGVAAIEKYLNGLGIATSALVIPNGAGLSREARINTRLMNAILQQGYQSQYMPEFVASLPIAGMDGTMRNRLQGQAGRGKMHIKTGSLDEVSAIAGYVKARSGKVYTVSGILNHELADRGPGTELMDALLVWVETQ